MFDQLRRAFSNATRSIVQKELSEKQINNILSDLELALIQSDIAQEVIDDLVAKLKTELIGMKLEKGQNAENIINIKFRNAFTEMFSKTEELDLLQKIKEKKENKRGPFVIAFLGINGTGKTTTVAKVAHLLHRNDISVVLAAGDTHRAGAIEQLSRHAEKLSIKVIAQRYGADPSAVGRDSIDYAKKHHIDAVLVDTAGRMQTAKNLMEEINKIVRVVKPDIKLFVGDALAGNDTINQAREFFQYTNFDGAILTKIDADAKGGAAISIVHITSKPIIYLGVGQGYDDLIEFDAGRFIEAIFADIPTVVAQDRSSTLVGEDISSASSLLKDKQKLEHKDSRDLSEDVIVTGQNHGSTQLKKRSKSEEKEGLKESQVGQPLSSVSSGLENLSSPPDRLDQTNSSTTLEKEILPEKQNQSDIDKKMTDNETHNLDGIKKDSSSSISMTSHRVVSATPSSIDDKIHVDNINKSEEKNKKSRFGGLFGRWGKGKNDIGEEQTPEKQSQRQEEQRQTESKLQESGKEKENKINGGQSLNGDLPEGQKEIYKRGEPKHKSKDDGDVVYLSNEDIEDMLK
jgi:fused signal recognition particle receptor